MGGVLAMQVVAKGEGKLWSKQVLLPTGGETVHEEVANRQGHDSPMTLLSTLHNIIHL